MILSSLFLRRALLADAVFSGISAVVMTLDAGALAPFLNLPEALLRETGLFLIAYAALVGWLWSRPSVPKMLVMIVIAGNAAWTLASIALLVLGRGGAEPAWRDRGGGAGDCDRRAGRAAIYRPAQERFGACGLAGVDKRRGHQRKELQPR